MDAMRRVARMTADGTTDAAVSRVSDKARYITAERLSVSGGEERH
jgi:hypothetical protein